MNPTELITYYINLLIVQYATKEKARGTIGAFVTQAVADMIANQVRAGFDLNTAIGAQLDAIGTYRGATRQIFGLDITKDYFSLMPYNGSPASFKGFSMAADYFTDNWYWLTVADFSAAQYTLNDGELRTLIRYLAAVQKAFHSVSEIDDILNEFFGEFLTVTDNLDMSLTYTHDTADPNLLFNFVEFLGVFPRPAGVSVNVVEV